MIPGNALSDLHCLLPNDMFRLFFKQITKFRYFLTTIKGHITYPSTNVKGWLHDFNEWSIIASANANHSNSECQESVFFLIKAVYAAKTAVKANVYGALVAMTITTKTTKMAYVVKQQGAVCRTKF